MDCYKQQKNWQAASDAALAGAEIYRELGDDLRAEELEIASDGLVLRIEIDNRPPPEPQETEPDLGEEIAT